MAVERFKMSDETLTRIFASLVGAFGMLWMSIPETIVVLMIMGGLDLLVGTIVSWIKEEFSSKKFKKGVLLKLLAFPLLAACHYAEGPLKLAFDLDQYGASALIIFEFTSVVKKYSEVRPLPPLFTSISEKALAFLQNQSKGTMDKNRNTNSNKISD